MCSVFAEHFSKWTRDSTRITRPCVGYVGSQRIWSVQCAAPQSTAARTAKCEFCGPCHTLSLDSFAWSSRFGPTLTGRFADPTGNVTKIVAGCCDRKTESKDPCRPEQDSITSGQVTVPDSRVFASLIRNRKMSSIISGIEAAKSQAESLSPWNLEWVPPNQEYQPHGLPRSLTFVTHHACDTCHEIRSRNGA